MTDEGFRAILEDVPKSYPAFVDGVMDDARDYDLIDNIANFIRDNPEATAGKVATLTGKLAGFI